MQSPRCTIICSYSSSSVKCTNTSWLAGKQMNIAKFRARLAYIQETFNGLHILLVSHCHQYGEKRDCEEDRFWWFLNKDYFLKLPNLGYRDWEIGTIGVTIAAITITLYLQNSLKCIKLYLTKFSERKSKTFHFLELSVINLRDMKLAESGQTALISRLAWFYTGSKG